MKKSLFSLMALAAVAMSCNKVEDPKAPVEEPVAPVIEAGVPYSFNAGLITKTVNDGLSTKWVAGDQISLFNAAAGASYTVNGAFTIAEADLEDGLFTGELASALEADAYDWAAIYPYNEANTSLEAASLVFGSANVTAAVDSKALLAGENLPLFGKAAAVAKDDALSINLSQLAAVAKIVVKNAGTEAYTLNKVTVTFPDAVVGAFSANLAGETPVYTAADGASATVVVTLAEAASIAAGATVAVYVPIKPFVAAADSKIAYKLNDDADATEIAAATFKAGVIKTVNFSTPLPTVTVKENLAFKGAGDEIDVPAKAGYTFKSAVASVDWISVADGKITVAANPTAKPRYALLTVKAAGAADNLETKYYVGQAAANAYMIFDSFLEAELSDKWVGNRELATLLGDRLELKAANFEDDDNKGQPLYYDQFIHLVNENTYNKVLVSYDFRANAAQCGLISYNVDGYTKGYYTYPTDSQWYSGWPNDCTQGERGGNWWCLNANGWCAMSDDINLGTATYTRWMRYKVDNGYECNNDHGKYSIWTLEEDENGILHEVDCVFENDKNWWQDNPRVDVNNPGKGGYMGLWTRNHPFFQYGYYRNFTICYENN